jgi:hypothetical protein
MLKGSFESHDEGLHQKYKTSAENPCHSLLGVWSLQGYVQDNDINEVTALKELIG